MERDREYWQQRIIELRHPNTKRSLKPNLTVEDLAEVILIIADRMTEIERRIEKLERK